MINITPTQLRKAADIQEKIQLLQEQLGQLLGGGASTPDQATEAPEKKWTFSAAARAKMRKAQKARWAKIRETEQSTTPATKRKMSARGLANIRAGVAKRMAAKGGSSSVQKSKRKFSAAGRAALAAAAKARWAKVKAAGKTRL